jgi:glycosyltransferase involved in cell wall biosynthesis
MLAVLLLACSRRPRLRWIKYAGNWRPTSPEAWSYTFQRWWLARGPHKACVTVNGRWPQQPAHVHSFYNPCLTDSERVAGREVALSKTLGSPVRLLFVGRLERAKGVERALHVVAQLIAGGTPVVLDLIGDGPARPEFEALIRDLGIDDHVRLHGWIPRPELAPFYGAAHIFLLPSTSSEGWPKVLGEAMAYGAVPVASDISSIPGNLKYFECGRACPAEDVAAYVKAILEYVHSPQQWALESRRAAAAAEHFTYTSYLSAVKTLLKQDEPWIA